MQEGSLVTPRWTHDQMLQKLAQIYNPIALMLMLRSLPDHGQIYTAKTVAVHCKSCNRIEVELEEIQVFAPEFKHSLLAEFYVEVAPPQENVQSIVDKIIIETPVRELS